MTMAKTFHKGWLATLWNPKGNKKYKIISNIGTLEYNKDLDVFDLIMLYI